MTTSAASSPSAPDPSQPAALHFRTRHRLTHAREFQAVLAAKVRFARGPLVLSALPNTLPNPRLGLMVGTRVGGAVVRNRLKRFIREAFRLDQHTLPASLTGRYDYVVGVRPTPKAAALTLDVVRRMLAELARDADAACRRRPPNQPPPSPPTA